LDPVVVDGYQPVDQEGSALLDEDQIAAAQVFEVGVAN